MSLEDIKVLFQKTRETFQKTLDWFTKEISSFRGSRLTIDLVSNIFVEYHSSKISLKEIASLSFIDSRNISIEPWDKSALLNIERALLQSSLGSVRTEQNRILFIIPPLTQEDKEKFIKLLRQKMEKAKVSLRQAREKLWRKIQDMEREGEISEDEKFKKKEELQKLIEEFEGKIKDIEQKKEKEITQG